jgi:F-type H+-transporting ATPase subunit a
MKSIASIFALVFSLSSHASGYTFISNMTEKFQLPEHVLTFIFVALLLLVVGFIYRIKTASVSTAVIPDNKTTFRNLFEAISEFIYNLAKNIMGEKEAKTYFPMIVMIFLFIFSSNLIGLIPGFLPPTDNINTTVALGLFVFLYYNFHGIRVQGLVGHLKHFAGPVWYLAPLIFVLEIISHCVRPISLGLRLKGNMEGDHLVLSIFSGLVPYIVPLPFYVIGIFVCFMQAFVFTILTMVYISLATEHHDHDEHGAHH